MNTKLFIYGLPCILLMACSSHKEKQESSVSDENAEPVEVFAELPPLEEGEVFYKNKDPFGEIINLTGRHIEDDTVIFKPKESEFVIKGNCLIVQNLSASPFMRFSLPEVHFIDYSGL
ncbi:MAG: hypothetical protein LBN71_08220, partial [Tannerella sp.]|nr:hypothetical protein [Tannerella sp.]